MGEHEVPGQQQRTVSIAIVGLGVRGLSVLERIISHAGRLDLGVEMRVHLVDPRPAQPRQYDVQQPDYLLLNHSCANVSMFPAKQSVPHAPPSRGPHLFEWAQERQLRVAEDSFMAGTAWRAVTPTDNLPRRVFGEYLLWFLDRLRDTAPATMHLIDHVAGAVDLTAEGDTSVLRLDNGDTVEADYVFVTVGQRPQPTTRDQYAGGLIAAPYPLPQQLDCVRPSDTVAIAGLGLTAADAILALTVGRGGRFDKSVLPPRYVPSGREPRIVLFSRSGLPYRARPAPSPRVSYEPVVFTRAAIDALRARMHRLDFDRRVLPLLLLELRVAYRRATLLQEAGENDAEVFLLSARAAAAEGRLEDRADLPDADEFDAEAVYAGIVAARQSPAPADGAAYQREIEAWMAADIAEAARGFEGSPFKAATETAREVRDVIRYAIEFGGISDPSLDRFYRHHMEAINRLVIGPEKDRAADVLTLLRSGVVAMPLGPDPEVSWDDESRTWTMSATALEKPETVRADWLYRGYTDRLRSLEDDPTVLGAMARRGLVRPFRPHSTVVSSVDVDRDGHPVSVSGESVPRIWIFGLACEGATFYNGYLTSPVRFERAQFDADRAVNELVEELRQERQMISAMDGRAGR